MGAIGLIEGGSTGVGMGSWGIEIRVEMSLDVTDEEFCPWELSSCMDLFITDEKHVYI